MPDALYSGRVWLIPAQDPPSVLFDHPDNVELLAILRERYQGAMSSRCLFSPSYEELKELSCPGSLASGEQNVVLRDIPVYHAWGG